jgi:CcmD family protein
LRKGMGMRRSLFTLAFIGSLWLLSAAAAFAQSGTATPTAMPPPRAPPGFEPVAGAPDTQKVDPNPLVVAAYGAILIGMFGYVVFVARRQSDIAKEMSELADRIKRAEKK